MRGTWGSKAPGCCHSLHEEGGQEHPTMSALISSQHVSSCSSSGGHQLPGTTTHLELCPLQTVMPKDVWEGVCIPINPAALTSNSMSS